MLNIITISRQYGSGGGEIAQRLSARLGWRLVGQSLVNEIATRARVSPSVAAVYDERVDPWLHRMVKALWQGGFEGAASTVENTPFDSETMAALTAKLILEAASAGEAVILGRGAQCILCHNERAFHVSIYAPRQLRIANLRKRLPAGTNIEGAMEESDRQRAAYVRRYFNRDWADRRLYHLLLCASVGIEKVVETILCASALAPLARA